MSKSDTLVPRPRFTYVRAYSWDPLILMEPPVSGHSVRPVVFEAETSEMFAPGGGVRGCWVERREGR